MVTTDLESDLALVHTLPLDYGQVSHLCFLYPLPLFVKQRATQFCLVIHVNKVYYMAHYCHCFYHYSHHGPYSFPAVDLLGCINLLSCGLIADLCQICIFIHCVLIYLISINQSPQKKVVWPWGLKIGLGGRSWPDFSFPVLFQDPGLSQPLLTASPDRVCGTRPPPFPASKEGKDQQLGILPGKG